MDVQMPVLDGYNATRAIRKDEDQHVREVLVIAMTASAIRGDREKCLEAGMNDYLAKPVRQTALKEMLDEYLNNTKSAQHAISAIASSMPTPGDKVNKETAKVPIKATTPAKESTERESGLTSSPDTKTDNKINGVGSSAQRTGDEKPSPSDGEKPSQNGESSQPAKPKKKRIAIKGSTRNKPISEESKGNGETTPPALNPDQNKGDSRTTSPPSGVKEQQILGKVSTDTISPSLNGYSKEDIENELAKTTSEQRRNEAAKDEEQLKSPEIKISPATPNNGENKQEEVEVNGS